MESTRADEGVELGWKKGGRGGVAMAELGGGREGGDEDRRGDEEEERDVRCGNDD